MDGTEEGKDVVEEWGEESFPASDAPTTWQGPEDYPILEAPGRLVQRVDGHEAHLEYEVRDDTFVIVHTEVPDAIEGRGVGGALVRRAVELAAAGGRTLAPWCPFARKWLSEHPDVRDRVTIDWSRPQPGA
jgi:predicted GNAT family acetyltransferase